MIQIILKNNFLYKENLIIDNEVFTFVFKWNERVGLWSFDIKSDDEDVVENNPGYKAHIEGQIKKQIDEIVRPVVEVNSDALPWAEPSSNTASEATANT